MRQFSTLFFFLGMCLTYTFGQTCSFSFSPSGPRCPQTPITFSADTSSDPNASYSWNFGDGRTANGITTTHTYNYNTSQQTFEVILTVNDSSGICRDTMDVTVLYQPPVIVDMNLSRTDTCRFLGACDEDYNARVCLSIAGGFTGTLASFGPYNVDWGDGATETGNGPCFSHTYPNYGSYPTTITSNGSSCPVFGQSIRNHSIPDPPTLFIPSATYCTGDTITAQISLPNPCPNNVDYYIIYWDFVGDPTIVDTFQTAGTIDHIYSFGNRPTAALQPVRIRAYGVNDCYDPSNPLSRYNEINLNIVVSPEPDFTDTAPICYPTDSVVVFNDASYPQAPFFPYLYEWDFGDPSTLADTSVLRNPSYAYPGPGVYPVSLTVTDTANCGSRTLIRDILVSEDAVAGFVASTTSGCGPLTVAMTNSSTPLSSPGVTVRYRWEVFGGPGYQYVGGTDSTSFDPEIQFNRPGNYRVRLTVLNPFCANDTASTIIRVFAPPSFRLSPLPDTCDVLSFQPTVLGLSDNGQPILNNASSPLWNFNVTGTGNPSQGSFTGLTAPVITWSPTTTAENVISLTLENTCGTTTVTDTFNLYSNQGITAGPDTTLCINDPVYCLNPTPAGGLCLIQGVVDSTCCFDPQVFGDGTFEVIYQLDTLGCSFFDTVVITVNPLPNLTVANDSVCLGDTLTLGASPVGGTFAGPNLLVGPSTQYVSTQVGLDTILYTFIDPISGCQATADFTVETLPLPNVLAGVDTSYCQSGVDEPLPTPNVTGGYWLNTGVADSTLGLVSTAVTGNRTIIYYYTDPFGCSNTDTLDIQIIPITPADAGPDDTLCRNATSVTLAGGGVWTSTSPGFSTPDQFDPLQANSGANELYFTIFPGTSCESRDTAILVVQDTVPVNITTPNATYCERDALDTLGASPAGGRWIGLGIVDPLVGSFEPDSLLPGSSTILTYQFLDSLTGCLSQNTLTARLNPLPPIALGLDTTYCYTAQLQELPIANPSTGTWSGIGLVPPTQFDPIVSDTGQFTFIYTVTDANGCTNTDSITISVIEPDSISAGPDTTVCVNGGTFTLPNFFPSTGVRWTGNGITDPLTGQYDPAQAGPGIDTCIICTGSGSCTICDTTLVTVDPAPPVVALNDSMCVDGGPISLDDNGLAFGVLTLGTWSGPGVNQVGLNSYTFDTTAFGLYPIVYEHTDSISSVGCTSRDTAFVRVDSLPIAAFPTPANACVGNLISLDNTSQGANSFDWTFGANPPLPSTDSLPQITYPDTGTFTITLVAISPAGCDDTTSRTIFISEPPQPFFSKSIDSACSNRDIIPGIDGIAVDFTDLSVPAGGRYRWDFGGGRDVLGNGTFNTATPPTIFFAQGKNDTTYFIRLSIINFCDSITYLDSVKVLPIPTAIFSPDSLTSCSPYVPNWRNNTAGSADTYAWYVDDFNTIESNDSVPRNIVLTYDGTTDTTYRVYMVASNACGSDTAFQDITVVPNTVDAFFSTSVVNGCAPLEVTFISYAGTPTRSFDLGDGTTSRLDTITHIYDEPGSYVVEHFADNGCSFDTNRITIEVFPFPELAIAPRDTIVCPNQAIQFRDTTGTGNSIGYQWFFGNGDSSTATSPVYTYSAPGTYIVSTSVISTVNGCPATDTTTIIVRQPPQAEFSVSDTAGCEPLEVTFTNQSSGALGYVWDFGEGTGSTLANPSFTYDTAGTYFIQLQAFDGFGCAGLAFDTVVVYPQPVAAFSFTLDDSCGGPAIGRFQNQSTGQLLGYQWDVGFDTSILTDPEFTFPQAGTYPVSLIANNAFGCADTARDSVIIYPQPVANWTVTPTDDCEPMVVTFANTSTDFTEILWDFGDQTSSTSLNPTQQHLYLASNGDTSYLARLIVRYEDVCVDSISQLIEVASAPNAQFIASEDSFCGAPATVSFTDQSQDFGEIVQYRWDFGDGAANQSNLVNPVHTFQDTDTFAVNLIVTNASGCRDTAEQLIYVFPQPQAVVVPDTTIGCYDFPVTFTTQDPDFGTGWQWDFGDGSQAFGKVVSHIYQFDGVFEAKVVIDHAQFCFDSATTTITVGTPPVANFSIEVDGQCDDTVRVTLTNNSVFADTYRWDFGDGRTSTEFEPALFYTFPGDYDIRLIAFNDFGCADTFVVEWEYPRAIAEFEIGLDDQRGCAPHTVRFTDESVAVTEWEWDFGDGTDPVFDQSPTHTYEIPGVYEVTLRVSFRGLCRDTFTYPAPIEVLESPTGDFIFERVSTIDPNTSDNRAIFRFTDTSPEPGESVRWNLGNGVTFSDRTFTYEYTENPPELWCDCSGPTPEDSLHQFLVTMVQSNPNGCRDTVQKWLEPQVHGLFMPNAIIPADPDTLISTFQAQAKGLCRLQFAVYNKWGNIIYEYDTEQEEVLTPDGTPTGGWRGTVNGQAVDNGVYIWRIQQAIFTGCEELLRERSDRQGTVTVIR